MSASYQVGLSVTQAFGGYPIGFVITDPATVLAIENSERAESVVRVFVPSPTGTNTGGTSIGGTSTSGTSAAPIVSAGATLSADQIGNINAEAVEADNAAAAVAILNTRVTALEGVVAAENAAIGTLTAEVAELLASETSTGTSTTGTTAGLTTNYSTDFSQDFK